MTLGQSWRLSVQKTKNSGNWVSPFRCYFFHKVNLLNKAFVHLSDLKLVHRGVTHTNTISSWSKHMRVVLDNITHTYQRPPSVGMPRHALRRRMPNSATGRPHLLGGQGGCPSENIARPGRVPRAEHILSIPTFRIAKYFNRSRNSPVGFVWNFACGFISKIQELFSADVFPGKFIL